MHMDPFLRRSVEALGFGLAQGMERSHWQARCAYQRATQHGGGVKKSNPMRQLCQWWYRRIQVRARVKIKQSKSTVSCAIREMQAEQR